MKWRVYAYHTSGRPYLMVTASPRDDNSFWTVVHSGFDASTPKAAAKSFDDLWGQGKPFPHQDDIWRAALKDPTLAAIHFDDFPLSFLRRLSAGTKLQVKLSTEACSLAERWHTPLASRRKAVELFTSTP